MPALQNLFSFSRTRGGAWTRLYSSENRYRAVQNLRDGKLLCYVIIQVAIFAAASCFAIRVHMGCAYLPSGAAQAAMDYPRTTSYIVTLIATVFSFLNTLLLGRVLKIALMARMGQPMSLLTLRGGLSLVTGQKLFGVRGLRILWAWIKSLACMRDGRKVIATSDRQYWTWLKYTVMYVALCGPLTSSWSSFLTPTPIDLQFNFLGQEVDLFNVTDQLQKLMTRDITPYPSESSPLNMTMAFTFGMPKGYGLEYVTMYTQAGYGAAASELGIPYYTPFGMSLYNGSTGGIYINDMVMMEDATPRIPSEYQDWVRKYSTIQQGFSADVRCRQQMLNVTGVYPYVDFYSSELSLGSSTTTPKYTVEADYGIVRRSMITNCSSDSVAYTNDILEVVDQTGSAQGDGILIGSVCKYQDFEKATNQSFLVLMQGFDPSYAFIPPTICEVSPRITSVSVGIDGTTVNISNTTNSEPMDLEGQDAVYIDLLSDLIWLMMFDTQSLSGNAMAASIQSLNKSLAWDSNLNTALENYLRGAIELSATLWRSELSSDIPTTQYNGIVRVQSMGYQYKRSTCLFLIVPLAVVMILTCAAAVYTSLANPTKPGDACLVEDARAQDIMHSSLGSFGDSEDFDPTNALHLMMLASRAPRGLDHEVKQNEMLQFHLE